MRMAQFFLSFLHMDIWICNYLVPFVGNTIFLYWVAFAPLSNVNFFIFVWVYFWTLHSIPLSYMSIILPVFGLLQLFFFLIIYLFIYLWLCWVFVSVRGLSLVAASGGHSSSWCAGLSPSRPLSLRSTGSRRTGSVIVAHGPSCSVACGIFPDQGSNPCPLHWQADSQPLHHQGSPIAALYQVLKSDSVRPLNLFKNILFGYIFIILYLYL